MRHRIRRRRAADDRGRHRHCLDQIVAGVGERLAFRRIGRKVIAQFENPRFRSPGGVGTPSSDFATSVFVTVLGAQENDFDSVLAFGAFFNMFVVLGAICAIMGFVRLTNPPR